jgi:hypothetical protein
MIQLAEQQQFSNTASTPQFQNWGPVPNVTNLFWSTSVITPLFPPIITFRVKDVIGNPEYGQYTEFRLKCSVFYFQSIVLDWVAASSYTANGYPTSPTGTPLAITANGLTFSFVPLLQNLNQIQPGIYELIHRFRIEGKLSSGLWVEISLYDHILRLTASDQLAVYSPQTLSYEHYQNTTLPSQAVNINGPLWTIVAPFHIILSSPTAGVTIDIVTNAEGTFYTASGTGAAEVVVALSAYYNGSPVQQFLQNQLTVLSGTSLIGYIPYSIQIFNQNEFVAFPESLEFYALKGISEAEPQNLFVYASEEFTFSGPPWLTLVEGTGTIGEFEIPCLIVTPIPSVNLDAGVLQGVILLEATIDEVESTIEIPVIYIVDDMISSPYGDIAFTLDPKFMTVSTATDGTFYQVNSNIKTFGFFDGVPREVIVPEKFPLFQKKQQFNIGKKVHQLMSRFPNPNENYRQYKPAEVFFEVSERWIEDKQELRNVITSPQIFVAGYNEAVNPKLPFLLDPSGEIKRVTTNGYDLVNFLATNVSHSWEVFRNGELFANEQLLKTSGWVCCKRINFNLFQPGDEITVEIKRVIGSPSTAQVLQKNYIVFPEGKYSTMVTWENDFLLQSVLEFTGVYSLKSEFEATSQVLFQNLVEVLEVLEVRKINKFSINTGWLNISDVDTIESLMRSRRAWVSLNGKYIELRAISKAMTNSDTERELIEYTVEFQINRTFNEKAYSF